MEAQGEEGRHVEIGDPEDVEEGETLRDLIFDHWGVVIDSLLLEEEGEEERTPREVEEDLRFSEELDDLKTRQFEPKVVNSLQNLSLQCVNDNTDYFIDKSELLNRLPVSIFQLLVDFLQKTPPTLSPEVFSLLISEKTRELCVMVEDSYENPEVNWSREKVYKIFKKIENKCKHTLTSLKLDVKIPEVSMLEQFNVLLASLKNLTELSFESIYEDDVIMTDDTLLVIGMNCKQLRSLRSSYSRNITDEGINYLCASAAPYGQCKKLEILDLEFTSVTEDGLVMALNNLPKLTKLYHDEKLLPALEKFVEINGDSKQLQLKRLVSGNSYLNLTTEKLEQICKNLPHVTNVFFSNVENVGAFLNIDAISEFEVVKLDTSMPEEFNLFMSKFSSSLTSIKICLCSIAIDISIFGNCPYLEDLCISGAESTISQFPLLPNSFKKLKKLFIGVHTLDSKLLVVPYVMQLISSPTLSSVYLNGIKLPESNLYSLIVQTKEQKQVFSNLERFEISDRKFPRGTWNDCNCNEYSLELLIQFICICPKLKELDVYGCVESENSYLQLKSFANRNNLTNIKFLMYGHPF